ncbi:Wzz/FepE/Etk N-terminal domain-containing protein [Marinobacter similis]|uniref:Polysaccharide chain length determinant N-terminal domain-containing protein n=1 Tax=Marinobacter similis TaxID=1420916 RepID=W5YMJ7_9GAMM|nr:Wzz/FepE/Etk N-terminal domain-containing protein [Marinobacter similis]AHI30139.1 hypothetical protein AU14_12740 [Marinobacter similis]
MTQYSNQKMEKPEEIGLVDLAAILVVRRMVAISVLLLTVFAGILYFLIAPDQYQYRSLFLVAQQNGATPAQSTQYLVSKLETFWLPDMESLYQKEGKRLVGKPTFDRTSGSTMIEFESLATLEDESLVRELHENLLDRLLKEQQKYLSDQKESFQQQLNSSDELIQRISGLENEQSLAAIVQVRNEIKLKLDGLRPAEVLTTARRSLKPDGRPAWQILVGFLVAGVVLGIMAAFVAEFVARVRAKLQ